MKVISRTLVWLLIFSSLALPAQYDKVIGAYYKSGQIITQLRDSKTGSSDWSYFDEVLLKDSSEVANDFDVDNGLLQGHVGERLVPLLKFKFENVIDPHVFELVMDKDRPILILRQAYEGSMRK